MRSPVATGKDAWKSVVIDGALADRGMISFAPLDEPRASRSDARLCRDRGQATRQQAAAAGAIIVYSVNYLLLNRLRGAIVLSNGRNGRGFGRGNDAQVLGRGSERGAGFDRGA